MHTLTVAGNARQSGFSSGHVPSLTENQWRSLAGAAKAACEHAYCPYSRFPVGAAVMTSDGAIASGCNVENASFGLTVCAERNAVFAAVAAGATSVVALVLYTPTPAPVTPCGACRQVIAEFGADASIRCVCAGPDSIDYGLGGLLPAGFTLHR